MGSEPVRGSVAAAIVGVVVLALLAGCLIYPPSVTSEMTEFLPVEESESFSIVRDLTRSTLSKHVVVLVDGASRDENRATLREMQKKLSSTGHFDETNTQVEDPAEKIHALYFPMRLNFLRDSKPALQALLTPRGMDAAANEFIDSLTGRFGPLVQRLGAQDPLLAYMSILERLESLSDSTLTQIDGQFTTVDGGAVLFLKLRNSPFDSTYATQVHRSIHDSFSNASSKDQELHFTGLFRYTHVVSQSMKRDMTYIGVTSAALLILLFIGVWGRLRWISLPLASLASAALVATVVTSQIFGSIHLLTVAFGMSLIGVCVDYSTHLLNHYALAGRPNAPLWRSIALSATTTSIGFGALIASDVPALRELATFAAVGIVTAAFVSCILAHRFCREDRPDLPARHTRALEHAETIATSARDSTLVRTLLLLLVIAPGLCGLFFVEWESGLMSLMNPAPELQTEEDYVRQRVSRVDSGKLIVVRGEDSERALQQNDAVAGVLPELVERGALSNFATLHQAVWSEQLQRMNREFIRQNEDALLERMKHSFGEAGVKPDRLQPIEQGSFALADTVLTLEALEESGFGAWTSLFAPVPGVLITYLTGVSDGAAVEKALEPIEGAFFVNQESVMNEAYEVFRESVTRLTLVGLGVIVLVLIAAFRDPRDITIAVLPPVIAAASTIGILSILGVSIGLAHLLSLLMVIGIGVDYGVMLLRHHHEFGQLALSILMAYLTSLAGFGVLMLSSHPVLEAIGITIATGTTASLFVLPAIAGIFLRDATLTGVQS